MHDAAVDLAEHGLRVMPVHYPTDAGRCSCRRICGSIGKHPRPVSWQTQATTDLETLDRWWSRDPLSSIGIATGGESRLVVLDIDPKDGGYESLDALLAQYGSLPTTPTVETGSGGRHYYFAAPVGVELRNSVGKTNGLGDGVDIRAEGGQVVAPPSLHSSGKRYRWAISLDDEDMAEIPMWIVEILQRAQGERKPAPAAAPGAKVGEGSRNDFLARRAGQLRRLALDEEMIYQVLVRENDAQCTPPLPDDEVRIIARSIAGYAPKRLPESPEDWRNGLRDKLDRTGAPTGDYAPTRYNVCVVLQHDQRWRGRIWFDEMRSQIRMGDRPLSEHDLVEIANVLDRKYNWPSLPLTTVHEAVLDTSAKAKVDVLHDYLDGLEWDGKPRLERWLYDAIGAEWDKLTATYARKFLIQAVARALRPGCQADTMLILVGEQGTGKSTLFRTLAGDEWFSDTVVDMRSGDRFARVNGVWFYEFAELTAFQGHGSESVKAFVSSRDDTWRAPYARTETHHKRRVVFVGTSNPTEFLNDPTGSRRFWPVTVTGPLNRSWLRSVRDQLWAEAVLEFRAGAEWHLTHEEEGWRQARAQQYQERDTWEPLIAAYVKDRPEDFTTTELLVDAIKVSPEKQGPREASRVTAALRKLGYMGADGHRVVAGKRIAARVWRQPATVRPIQGDLIEGMPESPERAGLTDIEIAELDAEAML